VVSARLGARVASATFWSYAAYAVGRGSGLVGLALVARLLSPHEFGIFAMAMVAINLLEVVKDFGLRPAVIYLLGTDEPGPVLDTAFYLSVGSGAALSALVLVLAVPAGAFFGDVAVTGLMQIIALYFTIAGIHAIPDAILRHRLDFRRRFWVEVSSPVARFGLAALFAVLGFGAWSLAIGQVAGIVAAATLAVVLAGWLPKLRFSKDSARKLARFASQLSLIDVLAAVIYNLDYLMVGYFLGSTALGLYSLAYKLPEAVLIGSAYVFSTVLLPTYVRLSNDLAELRAGFLRAFHYTGLGLAPAATGIAILAPLLVPLLFGDEWTDSVPAVRLLAVSAFLQGMLFTVGSVLVAAGRPRAVIVAQLASALTIVPGLYVAAQYSIVAVAVVHIAGALVFGVVKLALVCRALTLDWRQLVRAVAPTGLATAVMAFAIQGAWALTADWPDLMVTGVCVTTGAIVYGVMSAMLLGGTVRDLRQAAVAAIRGT
jgi:PST family polysaccharide transporter